jgi:putative heme-binding domain-containing protein
MKSWYVHLIGLLRDPKRHDLLRKIAQDTREPVNARAAALVHLSTEPADIPILIGIASQEGDIALRRAALQALQGATLGFEDLARLKKIEDPELQRLAARVLGEDYHDRRRPSSFQDIPNWKGHHKTLPGEPDIENGRRVFFSPFLGGCAVCHRKEGLGSIAGPNLTQIGKAATQDYVLESLLMPNLNLAPQWECFNITTTDGQTRTAFQLSERGGSHVYADLGGGHFEVKIDEIVKRDRMPVSIMPEGLVSKLTDEEVRDLVVYLSRGRD